MGDFESDMEGVSRTCCELLYSVMTTIILDTVVKTLQIHLQTWRAKCTKLSNLEISLHA